ncbi:hypothetical protein OG875_05265 [Streptomyces sp. NBC_01498]|uniref:hypothetical protein n=1 Tax=Streptomyces sp. NBC_01498 TaxID=2975870 RepID=UPI002E7C42D3|nr:hypothetical protein [Streptomyces sp. NBC_01498]WTL24068.1 hypothetical protein OG875_05265 [Streptomyces sp. NBC_01498]
MTCDEPLYRDGEEFSSRDCQLKLGHSGDHDYLGEKFPRPELTEPDPDITNLIAAAAHKRGIWGLDEVQWPIVVEVTTVYVVRAPGATEDEALANYGDEYPDLDGEHAIDGSFEVRRLESWQRRDNLGTSPFGPMVQCPGCGKLAMSREWFHNPLRKCHGPIRWRETRAPSLRCRYSREYTATPVYNARQTVAA